MSYQVSHIMVIQLLNVLLTTFITLIVSTPSFCVGAEFDNKLVDQYIQTKGSRIIVFDSSNIKQFWVDHSVFSQNNNINILLNSDNSVELNSTPLKIQLANVNLTEDCIIEVLTGIPDLEFSVLNSKSIILSTSSKRDNFLDYNIISSIIHLHDFDDLSFSLKFSSKSTSTAIIKGIILSFVPNKAFANPKVTINANNATIRPQINFSETNSFSVTGKRSQIVYNEKISLSDTPVYSSVKIKNVGNNSTKIYTGYSVFSEEDVRLDGRNYPYAGQNNVLTVVSSQDKSDKIIVDKYSRWVKNCFLATSVNEDMSDIPNSKLAEGKIVDVKKLENDCAEITLDKPIVKALEKGTKVRIHGIAGGYLYTKTKVLQPGEEFLFVSKMQRDVNLIVYNNSAFPKGVYYVKPVVLSYSINEEEDNTIIVSDFNLSF